MLKKTILIISFLSFVSGVRAQVISEYKYWVGFTDKKASAYSLERPKEFLSYKALDRRTKFHIEIDSTDIPVNSSYIDKLAGLEGVEVRNRSKWLNGVTIHIKDTAVLNEIKKLPFVREVKLVGYEKLQAIFTLLNIIPDSLIQPPVYKYEPKPIVLEDRFGKSYYGTAFNQIAMCNGDKLHKTGFNGSDVYIACIDAGFSNLNALPALRMVVKGLVATYDFVEGNDTVFDDDDHGLEVLSCMAAYEPGKMVGTAPYARYVLLRSEDAATEFPVEEINWVCAAEFADSAGVDIITSSVGYTQFDDKSMGHVYTELNGHTTFITRGAELAVAKGILVCNSAGNEGDNKWKFIGAPADANSIITLGSVNAKGEKSDFSSVGPTADKRIKPTLAAMGELATVYTPYGMYMKASGTSFSTPVFAGMLACLVQANRTKTPAQVMDALKMSGSNYPVPNNQLGYGIPDMVLANKILGGDTAIRLNQDQLVDISVPVNSPFITVTFHAESDNDLKLIIAAPNGKKKVSAKYVMRKGQTERYVIKGYKKLKPGNYTLYVLFGPHAFKAEFTK
ncbi:MAG: S8 family serine peptidase [Bacteroidia bacterium]|nr:S8 family serine peptidase [Bacteroidia bacterium]